jgi:hypothetical protein
VEYDVLQLTDVAASFDLLLLAYAISIGSLFKYTRLVLSLCHQFVHAELLLNTDLYRFLLVNLVV